MEFVQTFMVPITRKPTDIKELLAFSYSAIILVFSKVSQPLNGMQWNLAFDVFIYPVKCLNIQQDEHKICIQN